MKKNFEYSKISLDFIHIEIYKLVPEKQNTNFLYSILNHAKFQISSSQQNLSDEFQIS